MAKETDKKNLKKLLVFHFIKFYEDRISSISIISDRLKSFKSNFVKYFPD